MARHRRPKVSVKVVEPKERFQGEASPARAEAHLQACADCARRRVELAEEALDFDVPLRLSRPAPDPSWRLPLGLETAAAGTSLFLPLIA